MSKKELQITYLLGAGASADRIRVAADLQSAISSFGNGWSGPVDHNIGTKIKENIGPGLQADLDWFKDIVAKFSTSDLFARKCYFSADGADDLLRLKRLLSFYFVFKQWIGEGRNSGNEKRQHFKMKSLALVA